MRRPLAKLTERQLRIIGRNLESSIYTNQKAAYDISLSEEERIEAKKIVSESQEVLDVISEMITD